STAARSVPRNRASWPRSVRSCLANRSLKVVHFVEAAGVVRACAALSALPAGRAVGRTESGRLIEARGAITAKAPEAAGRFLHLDVLLGQFIEEARRHVGLP